MMKLVSVKGSLKRLEPYDGKLSRTVLRGREDSNISPVTRHIESFFHTLKVELAHGENYRSKNEASSSIAYYIEAYYNRKRLHSAINYNIPLLYESLAVAA